LKKIYTMNYSSRLRAHFVLLLFMLFSISAFAQLSNFTLTVAPTAQTCLGNGSLSFAVSGNNPLATMSYQVFLLPNTTTPITIVTTPTVGGLANGNYQVLATQTLNGQSNTSTANATIANNVVPLTYTLVPTNVRCGNDGVITVTTNTGTPVSYEITAGPVLKPLQTSNVFTNLPVGLYQVRVYDNCGEAVVVSIQLIQLAPGISVGSGVPTQAVLPSCTTISVGNAIAPTSPTQYVFYPLTVQFTVFPPGGAPSVVVNTTIASGSVAGANIPFYYNQQYSYNIVITDACGNVYFRNNNVINEKLEVVTEVTNSGCTDNNVKFTLANYRPPFTIAFTSPPPGFNPATYNPQHPTFSSNEVEYGLDGTAMPVGPYTGTITDACGHTVAFSYIIEEPSVSPAITGTAICGSAVGGITITMPEGVFLTHVTLQVGPVGYTPQPADLTSQINGDGALALANMPLGQYTFYIEDSCGNTYTKPFTLAVTSGSPLLNFLQRPGCDIGTGSVRINVPPTVPLVQVTITAGPPGFATGNYSSNIATTGVFFMNSLPAGLYTFHTVDNCGIERTQDYTIIGYSVPQNNFTVIPHCGSFDLAMAHTSTTGTYQPAFFLQRFDPITNTWGHPDTGVPYPANSTPLPANSLLLTNNATNINLAYIGQFRVVKVFYVYSNGSAANARCLATIYSFTFDDGPQITDAYTFPCGTGLSEVAVIATGVAPLTYAITSKNGQPFTINNGTANIFSGLESATYNFQVTDVCGNIRNIQFDINALDPVEIVANGFCEGEDSSLTIQEFSFLDYAWYEESNPTVILSTTGTLAFPAYNSANDAGTYILSITSDNPASCLNQLLEHVVLPNVLPNAGPDATQAICNEGLAVDLTTYLTAPFDAGGTWAETTASGALTGNTFDTDGVAEGTYTFTYKIDGVCGLEDIATITLALNDIPLMPVTDPVTAVCEGTDVQLGVTAVTGINYQWTGPNGFTSNLANPLLPLAAPEASGTYSVVATSASGCASPPAVVQVTINATPQFIVQGNTLLCDGQSSGLAVLPVNFDPADVTFTWYQGGVVVPGLTVSAIEIFEPGIYRVDVTRNGCTNFREVTILPNLNAFSFDVEAGCVDENYIIAVTNMVGIEPETAQYDWEGPGAFSYSGGPSADITNGATGDYTVTVTSPEGCTVTEILPVDNTRCSIPKGISPNGDEFNNNFDLSNLEVQHLVIFNRYGMQVYEASNYINEWHGQSDAGELPTGVYYYVATLSAGKKRTGWVYLQREAK
jgi:gliding motility-associated-like protein